MLSVVITIVLPIFWSLVLFDHCTRSENSEKSFKMWTTLCWSLVKYYYSNIFSIFTKTQSWFMLLSSSPSLCLCRPIALLLHQHSLISQMLLSFVILSRVMLPSTIFNLLWELLKIYYQVHCQPQSKSLIYIFWVN